MSPAFFLERAGDGCECLKGIKSLGIKTLRCYCCNPINDDCGVGYLSNCKKTNDDETFVQIQGLNEKLYEIHILPSDRQEFFSPAEGLKIVYRTPLEKPPRFYS